MDKVKKRLLEEFQEMEREMGRMIRNMSLPGMMHLQSVGGQSATDVYEAVGEIFVYMDVAGAEPGKISVTVERTRLVVAGERHLPGMKNNICRVHQLEIEQGRFQRTVSLPVAVEVGAVSSRLQNGILEIRLPKEKAAGKYRIMVE